MLHLNRKYTQNVLIPNVYLGVVLLAFHTK